jgi:hypothetical protein
MNTTEKLSPQSASAFGTSSHKNTKLCKVRSRKISRSLPPFAALIFLLFVTAVAAFAQEPRTGGFTIFDVPGAGKQAGQGTLALSINASGEVTGYYVDDRYVSHGFVRSAAGTITEFNVNGAGTKGNQGTEPCCINDSGVISGSIIDGGNTFRGFVSTDTGAATIYSAPKAGTGVRDDLNLGTYGGAINDSNTVTGSYIDGKGVCHGFIRSSSGTITTFDVSGAGDGFFEGTIGNGINSAGTVVGYDANDSDAYEGYVRAASGQIQTVQVKGAGTGQGQGTHVLNINDAGTLMGYYGSASAGGAFVLTSSGRMTKFNCSTAFGTNAESVNSSGTVAGLYVDHQFVTHGFTREAGNTDCNVLDAPGAGAGIGLGTFVQLMNDSGEIVGYFVDSNGVSHGFIWTP